MDVHVAIIKKVRESNLNLAEAKKVLDVALDEQVEMLKEKATEIQKLTEVYNLIKRSIIEQMEEMGSERYRTKHGVVEITRSVKYNQERLAALREITDPADLDKAYTPAHDELLGYLPSEIHCNDEDRQIIEALISNNKLLSNTEFVPEKWNMASGRRLSKLSDEHRQIIESAKMYGDPNIKISEDK